MLHLFRADTAATLVSLVSSTDAADPYTWLINAGSLGVIILLVVTGQLRTKAEVNQLNARITYLESQLAQRDKVIEAFQMALTGQTLPALARSAQVIEHLPANEAIMRDEVRNTANRVELLTAQLAALVKKEADEA